MRRSGPGCGLVSNGRGTEVALTVSIDGDEFAVCVEGDRDAQRFALLDDAEDCYLAFGDGTVLYVAWSTASGWRMEAEHRGTAALRIRDVNGVPEADLEGDLRWVMFGLASVPIGI